MSSEQVLIVMLVVCAPIWVFTVVLLCKAAALDKETRQIISRLSKR